jgi:hypothetical protein
MARKKNKFFTLTRSKQHN